MHTWISNMKLIYYLLINSISIEMPYNFNILNAILSNISFFSPLIAISMQSVSIFIHFDILAAYYIAWILFFVQQEISQIQRHSLKRYTSSINIGSIFFVCQIHDGISSFWYYPIYYILNNYIIQHSIHSQQIQTDEHKRIYLSH